MRDAGQTIGLTVRATDTTGTTAAYAPLAGLVAGAGTTPVATKQPPESGEPIVGQGLKVEAATWSATPAALTYAWRRLAPPEYYLSCSTCGYTWPSSTV